jgi:hypothetical protein
MKRLLWWLLAGTRGGRNRARIIMALHERPYNANQTSKTSSLSLISTIFENFKRPAILISVLGGFYVALQAFTGFSYIEAFLYASYLENPDGFMLLTNPGNYIITRAQNILDIAFFFGPFLIVLGTKGMHHLRNSDHENQTSRSLYPIVLAALISLGLLFLAGAPKKGETARICMFILPILLMPVISYLESFGSGWKHKMALIGLVFLQAVIMQAFFVFIW